MESYLVSSIRHSSTIDLLKSSVYCRYLNTLAKLKTKKDFSAQIKILLHKMTLEEKIGQMNQYSGFYDATGPVPEVGNASLKIEHLKKGLVGSMLNVTGVDKIRNLQRMVVEESRLGIPMLFGFDVIHGLKTLSPIPLAEAASWDMEAIEKSARVAAVETSASGVNWTFAPMVDISRDARWGRVMEGGGEDPFLGAQIAKARIKGFQGEDLSAHNTIAACAKHLAAYGFVEAGREYNTVDIGTNTLFNIVLPPFKAAVESGVSSVMNAFNILNGVPATGDRFLQRQILKEQWNFSGLVVSDWGSIRELVIHGYAKNLEQAAQQAINAGCDIDMESYGYIKHLVDLVQEGKVSEKLIDDAVTRILRLKFKLGLFDDPYRYCNNKREKERLNHKDHHAAVLDIAQKSIVLLKNENNLLPLKKDQDELLIIGDLADDKNSPLGSWRIASDDHTAVSLLEGIHQYIAKYTFEQGPKIFDDSIGFRDEFKMMGSDEEGIAKAVTAAKKAKMILMVMGEHAFQSGEGRSRTSLDLPGDQLKLLKAVYEVNQNIVLVLMNGRPLTIPWAAEHIPSILVAWQLGSQTGNAIAKVLFGDYNPSAKLPMTFPRSIGQVPIYYNHFSTGRPQKIHEVFWSHYIDEENSPLFPFGFGLSYTNFDYSNLKIKVSKTKGVKVLVNVRNCGDRQGEEVVQLYLHDRVASITRPVKELKGFKKINLAPGETQEVEFTLGDAELGFYNHAHERVVEPGKFDVMVGTNSQKGLTGRFTWV
ncbi:MAG: beta-glucosidase BglX [Croceitalea sp.]|nr:beta-glucosidase BglX [Croceitalea sp.]